MRWQSQMKKKIAKTRKRLADKDIQISPTVRSKAVKRRIDFNEKEEDVDRNIKRITMLR